MWAPRGSWYSRVSASSLVTLSVDIESSAGKRTLPRTGITRHNRTWWALSP
jgi:hypothetical protein